MGGRVYLSPTGRTHPVYARNDMVTIERQEPYSAVVPVRLTPSQKRRLLQVSRVTGTPVSELVRKMIDAEIDRYQGLWDSIKLAS